MLLREDFAFASLRSKSVFFIYSRVLKFSKLEEEVSREREREIIIALMVNARNERFITRFERVYARKTERFEPRTIEPREMCRFCGTFGVAWRRIKA